MAAKWVLAVLLAIPILIAANPLDLEEIEAELDGDDPLEQLFSDGALSQSREDKTTEIVEEQLTGLPPPSPSPTAAPLPLNAAALASTIATLRSSPLNSWMSLNQLDIANMGTAACNNSLLMQAYNNRVTTFNQNVLKGLAAKQEALQKVILESSNLFNNGNQAVLDQELYSIIMQGSLGLLNSSGNSGELYCEDPWSAAGLTHCTLSDFLTDVCEMTIPCAYSAAQTMLDYFSSQTSSSTTAAIAEHAAVQEMTALACADALFETLNALEHSGYLSCPFTCPNRPILPKALLDIQNSGQCSTIASQCSQCPAPTCISNAKLMFGC